MYSVLQPLDASFATLIEFVNDTEASPASIAFLNPLAFSFELNIVGLEERRLKQSSTGRCGSHPRASRWSQSERRRIDIDWRHHLLANQTSRSFSHGSQTTACVQCFQFSECSTIF